MKLFQIPIILLFVVFTDGVQPKRCYNNVAGYCRKKCKSGEIAEVGCLHAKYCCVNEMENRKYKIIRQPVEPIEKSNGEEEYFVLPTVTYFTISI